jgi:hypothetical protein
MIKSLQIDFDDNTEAQDDFILYEKIIKDHGSVYSVSLGRVECRDDIKAFLQKIRNYKVNCNAREGAMGYNKKYQNLTMVFGSILHSVF